MIQIEDSSEYIRDIPDLDARDPDDRPDADLHHEPHFRRNEEGGIPAHLSEFFGGLFHIALALAIEFMDRVEIIYETDDRYDRTEHEDDKKPVLVDIRKERMEKEGEEKEIEVENASDTERYRFSLVSVRCWVIKESESEKEMFPCLKYDERGNERNEQENTELCKDGE